LYKETDVVYDFIFKHHYLFNKWWNVDCFPFSKSKSSVYYSRWAKELQDNRPKEN
jgi:hypothetical protein